MKKKEYRSIALVVLFFVMTAIAGISFYKSEDFTTFLEWSQQNVILYACIVVGIKIVGVVYPPLPGSIFTVGSIPIVGWQVAYLIDFVGSFIGAIISFLIARKYGKAIITRFISRDSFTAIAKTKVNHSREVEAVVAMRVLGGSTIIEAVNYGAGLLNISLKNFILGFIVSHPLTGIPVFYFSDTIFSGGNTYISIGVAIVSLTALYKLKGRYFE